MIKKIIAYTQVILSASSRDTAWDDTLCLIYRQDKLFISAFDQIKTALYKGPFNPLGSKPSPSLSKAVNNNSPTSNDIRALYNLGVILKNNGKIDEAYERFNKAFNIEPKYIEPILGIGKIYEEKQNFLEAKKYYEKALALDNNHKLANQLYGKLLMKLNDIGKAQYFNYKSSGVIRFNEKQIEII